MTELKRKLSPCYVCKSCDKVSQNYLRSYEWILYHQNRDGSFGKSSKEKAILTPHCVHFFAESGLPISNIRFIKAINWLKTNLTHEDRPLWYGRIPALVAANEIEWLKTNDDIKIFLDDLGKNRIDDFFWFVLPALIYFHRIGIEAPYEEAVIDLYRFKKEFSSGNLSFMSKPNYTGLALLYLYELDKEKYSADIEKMVHWIIENHVEEENGVTHWGNSIGITSYVLIDLANIESIRNTEIFSFIESSLRFIQPLPDGSLPSDNPESRTYNTPTHQGKAYTTLLASRAMACILGRENCAMTTGVAISAYNHIDLNLKDAFRRFFWRYKNSIIWTSFTLLMLILIIILYFWLGAEKFREELGLIVFGTIFGFFAVFFRDKIINRTK